MNCHDSANIWKFQNMLNAKKHHKGGDNLIIVQTVQFKLLPTVEQEQHLQHTTHEFINCANDLVDYCIGQVKYPKLTSSSFRAALPSAVRSEVCETVKSILRKSKGEKLPVLKKPVAIWNNQNYKVNADSISFPVWVDGKCQRITVNAIIDDYQHNQLLGGKLGTLRITQKSGKWIAQVAIKVPAAPEVGDKIMGVDLGLKVPAVAVTEDGATKFSGNGRKNKYMKRKHRSRRKALGKAKKQKAIEKLDNKEQRWMCDQDHKISRELVNFAILHGIGIIHMELLQNIRETARTSRKNRKNLHTWSFYRLAQFIEYKANLVGIRVEYVNPAYTSQTCPDCGKRNKARDRKYKCSCGFTTHRDRLGAINIISAPVVSDNREPA